LQEEYISALFLHFLQLDITKTKDNKTTFIHVLAEAVFNKFPDMVSVGEDLTTVPVASKGEFCL